MNRFDNNVILVTGAAGGIGQACVDYLCAHGGRVYGLDLDGKTGQRIYAGRGPSCAFRETDLRDSAAIQAAVEDLLRQFGRLDAVVNCAGIYPTGKRLEALSDEEWDNTLAVNLTSIFKVCRASLPLMRKAGGGSVVNIASVHAEATVTGVPAYAATKGGVVSLSRQMALDYAVDHIRVNSVLVGAVATHMTLAGLNSGGPESSGLSFEAGSIGRIAEPHEIARAIGFLISPDASFVTGSALQVDGGLLARLLN